MLNIYACKFENGDAIDERICDQIIDRPRQLNILSSWTLLMHK